MITILFEVKILEQKKTRCLLHQQIEVLREKLHRQKDITHNDALKLSAELDLLILEVMRKNKTQT